MAVGHPNYDALLSTTLANYRNQLEDNVSTNVALWWWLSDKKRVKTKSGGHSFVMSLLYAKNSTSKTYALYEDLDITPQGGITSAVFDWRQHAVSIAIAGLEEAMNNSDEEVIDLLQAKIQQAEMTAQEDFAVMFAGDGTGNTNKNFLGIKALIGDQASGVTTVGGIDSTDAGNTWWRSYVNRTVQPLSLSNMRLAFQGASRGNDKPNGIFSGSTLWNKHVDLLQPQQRFTDDKTAQAGFENITFLGAPHVADGTLETAEVGSVYFLNSKYIAIYKLGDNWLKNGPFERPVNRDARYSQIISYGNMGISNRKLGGSKLEGKTA